jgi:hypothetical protein
MHAASARFHPSGKCFSVPIYTGIEHIAMQDRAITESMGDIVDHNLYQGP